MRKEYLKAGFVILIWFIIVYFVEWFLLNLGVVMEPTMISLFSILMIAVMFLAIGLFLPTKD